MYRKKAPEQVRAARKRASQIAAQRRAEKARKREPRRRVTILQSDFEKISAFSESLSVPFQDIVHRMTVQTFEGPGNEA